jgi:hypothetical protein
VSLDERILKKKGRNKCKEIEEFESEGLLKGLLFFLIQILLI